ncbi:UNVERIFIED_CONTAM: hypothetical protein RMT77_010410 [Armadillidium vulgare]
MAENSTKPSLACSKTSDCTNITNSVCSDKNFCDCEDKLPVFISSVQECTRSVPLNFTCEYEEQCAHDEDFSTCDKIKKICTCTTGYEMKSYPDIGVNCVTKAGSSGSSGVDPAMIGVLAGLALMFVIICVVLRLFSKARFRENRSIFNTPNPRLMNASLFKDSKLLSPARGGSRRGSRASMRGPPSRAPSITSVNKDGVGRSPNGSLSKGRRGSTLSTASATGSAAASGPPPSAKTPSPTSEKKQPPEETAVAIEAVD